jgi:uncharacterized repeat protein (TIGR03809 family)
MGSQLDVTRGREIVARWCALAERRLDYLTELFETGRWRRFYGEHEFLENIREAKNAVGAWRDMMSCEGSRDNRSIDMSWIARRRTPAQRAEMWRDPLPLVEVAEILRGDGRQEEIAREGASITAGDVPSVPATEEVARAIAPEFRTIAERYPLLRNAL